MNLCPKCGFTGNPLGKYAEFDYECVGCGNQFSPIFNEQGGVKGHRSISDTKYGHLLKGPFPKRPSNDEQHRIP